MTPEFVESCDKMNKMFGGSAFLCVICRKLAGKINKTFREMETRMEGLESKLKTAELERNLMATKLEKIESKADHVKEKMGDMEKEVETGMEKAVREAKAGMEAEMKA